ncbi:glutamine synthetase/guanido kinase [Atractiella rhizophila]|nr:glutamine synthetase/guanido kinase [Atractiella rhizophila]
MSTKQSPKSIEELEELLKHDDRVKVAGIDIDGVLRGKIMSKSKFISSAKSGFGFCSVVFGWDIHDATYSPELSVSNIKNGYKDLTARIDLDTFRRIPWEGNIPFFLVTFLDPDTNDILPACPRGLLQRIIEELKAEGLEAFCGAEYEYFNFQETPQSLADKKFRDPVPLTPGMHGYSLLRPNLNREYFDSIFTECNAFGIEIEGHHTETGPGVFETALAYTSALRMADNASLFKLSTKLLGSKYGIMPTFMAKPHNNLPGTSGHIHISLRDIKTGHNLFATENGEVRADASYEDTKRVSKICEYFVAGVLRGLEDVMPCLAPNVNSYKRLVENFWAPVNVSYAYESRVASVRIISPPIASAAATRIEVRVPGADSTPHLAFAAILGLGLSGIKEKLDLPLPPVNAENANDPSTLKRLPKNLYEATMKMIGQNSMARKVLGDGFVDHYGATREQEWTKYSTTVTDFELQRYFELV